MKTIQYIGQTGCLLVNRSPTLQPSGLQFCVRDQPRQIGLFWPIVLCKQALESHGRKSLFSAQQWNLFPASQVHRFPFPFDSHCDTTSDGHVFRGTAPRPVRLPAVSVLV